LISVEESDGEDGEREGVREGVEHNIEERVGVSVLALDLAAFTMIATRDPKAKMKRWQICILLLWPSL
jgi:hypothetical protein